VACTRVRDLRPGGSCACLAGPVRLINSPAELQRVVPSLPRPLVFVPTMGALHQGHLALVTRAKEIAANAGTTVVSVFVNPTQFGPNEDFQRYPRPFEQDCEKLARLGCDLVFAPAADAMYRPQASVVVRETSLSRTLCGASRPGHFDGVCTVVTKLFHLVQPDFAVFGQKDFQQLAIIRRLVRDLNFPIEIIGVPTVREADGLAMSSRNACLSPEERAQAPSLHQVLESAAARVREKAILSPDQLIKWMRAALEEAPLANVDYVAVADPETLEAKQALRAPFVLAVAVYFGRTRLIDHTLVDSIDG
jgi:pantoate--beta-alanine ligase